MCCGTDNAARREETGLRALRVAYITTVPVQGGAELNLLRILPHLIEIGVIPAVILVPPGGGVAERYESSGYRVRRFNLYRRDWRAIWRYWQSLAQLLIPIIRSQADAVHINHHYGLEFTVRAARLAHCPFVIHVRAIEPVAWVRANRALLESSDGVIAVSQAVKRRLMEGGVSSDRIDVIYDGVDIALFDRSIPANSLRRQWQIPEGCRLVGMVGRMDPLKGISDFLRAAQLVARRLGDVRFAIVGDGQADYMDSLKALVRDLGLSESVVFPGFQRDIQAVFAALDLLVVATYDPSTGQGEACPNIALEAMASRVPVLARRAGGVIELLEPESGVMVDPDGVEPLVDGIMTVLQMASTERRAITDRAYEAITTRFTLVNQGRHLRRLYDQVLGWPPDVSEVGESLVDCRTGG